MKKQTIIPVILVAALVLIVGGVYYAKKMQKETGSTQEEVQTPSSDESAAQNDNSSELAGEEAASLSAEPTPPQVDLAVSAKFNAALKNGSDAFVAGNYSKAIAYYKEALSYRKFDVVYARLFAAYSAQNDTTNALASIDAAISLNPGYTEYWNTKIGFLDEKTSASYADLKKVYTEGLAKVSSKTKINLVTFFAQLSERSGEISSAISLWEYAKNLYPANASIYQKEIERLKAL